MNKGLKIGLAVSMTAVVGVIVYLMFFKKDSKIYVLKPKLPAPDQNGESSDSETPTQTDPTATTPNVTAPADCKFPQVPFKNSTEGNAFRDWVNDAYKSVANKINLDRTGSYNNCFIREAFAYKTAGGRTLGNIWLSIQSSEPQGNQGGERDYFEDLAERLKDQKIPFKLADNGAITVKIHSSASNMDAYGYQFAFADNGRWAVALFERGTNTPPLPIATGSYNLESTKPGTRLNVESGTIKNGGSMVGFSRTANNDNVWTMQRVIQHYWSKVGMSDAQANSLKAVSSF